MFNPVNFSVKSSAFNGRTVAYRAYEGIIYVNHPLAVQHQSMNIYIPLEYYDNKSVSTYDAKNAPIFFPNSIGGYMPALPGSPGLDYSGRPNAILTALSKGYVVATPGARGRTNTDSTGRYIGKAPASIVDLKAAVRYLRSIGNLLPGNTEKIVSNGTSAGGALSALLGATGNNQDYKPYLEDLGAAEARDDIFAVSAYCPITNLENSDTAYEWLFDGIAVSPDQIRNSTVLKSMFPTYLNSLGLKSPDGELLTLDANGNGPFKEHVKSYLISSAQSALLAGDDLSNLDWVTIRGQEVTDIDLFQYAEYAGRLKSTSAFDSPNLTTPENDLFGTETTNTQHFTTFGQEHNSTGSTRASEEVVKLMNPMDYIGEEGTTTSQYWRIRHGAMDRDTSLAIPIILATKLENCGINVDFSMPWGQGHGGDYDLDELFTWIEQVCR